MEVIGAILYYVGKGLFYFFKYSLPLWFVGLAITLSSSIGGDKIEKAQWGGDWAQEKRMSLKHEVKVCWNAESGATDSCDVREDRLATVKGDAETTGGNHYSDNRTIYAIENVFFSSDSQDAQPYCAVAPVEVKQREGYRLLGFFNTPYGGVMYFNAGGYAVRTIEEDVTVYAVYEPIANPAS